MNRDLAVHGGPRIIDPDFARFVWPVITPAIEEVVLRQLHTTLSIYDRSGIFAEFEDAFTGYHGRQFGLLSNSGTSSILAMFEGVGLGPGDEVLCPVYTFHATVSPLVYLGATPVFCDSDTDGNISVEEVQRRMTPRTRAVVVTHMWGTPVADIARIADFCTTHGIHLLEDCSHAHGAKIAGKNVGTFGAAAAWSLQGQKIITGGEGGILLTDDQNIYDRALLHGHYNKRPQREMATDNPLRRFYLTGFGLKLRAHPIAIAIANEQFGQLDSFIATKQSHADRMSAALAEFEFLSTPSPDPGTQRSWYGYNLAFRHGHAGEVTREAFVDALHAEGLVEADIPGSTGLLHELPLFNEPEILLPRLYREGPSRVHVADDSFPSATKFHDGVIKFPVWAFPSDSAVTDAYIEGIRKVAQHVQQHGTLLPEV